MNPEWQKQAEMLATNLAAIAEREQTRIRKDLRQIDRAYEKHGTNGSGRDKRDKVLLSPITLHDKSQNDPRLRALLREFQNS